MSPPPTFFTASRIKTAAQLSGTQYDAALPGWIATLEHQIEQFTGLRLTQRTEIEFLDGKWHNEIMLPGRPVSAVLDVRVFEGGDYDPLVSTSQINFMGQNPLFTGTLPAPLLIGVDYGLQFDKSWSNRRYSLSGRLIRNGREWPGAFEKRRGRITVRKVNGSGNIRVQYTYGFASADDVPPVFETAVAAGVRAFILRIPTGGVIPTSQSLDGASLGSQIVSAQGGGQSGLYFPELGSIREAMQAYVVPRVY
jgi:hypothetical protein